MDVENAEQFAAFWTASQGKLAAFIRILVPDLHEADEVLQRVAVALVRKFHEFDRSKPFAAWAVGAAKFEVLNYRRQRAKDRHVFDNDLVEQIAANYVRLMDEFDPRRDALNACLDTLDGRSRVALGLRYGRGWKLARVAEELQLTIGAARMILFRTRQALRECIERRIQELG